MKLTKYLRQAFVRAAMNDLPTIDFNDIARKRLQLAINSLTPHWIAERLTDTASHEWIMECWVQMPGVLANQHFFISPRLSNIQKYDVAAWADLCSISDRYMEHINSHKRLSDSLTAAAASCATRKQLAELLPCFEKYLPSESAPPTKNLPMVIDIAEKFKAAGWPKGSV